MKKKLFKITIVIVLLALYSCEDRMKSCVEGMMNDGYSYDEAWDSCEDARYESQIR